MRFVYTLVLNLQGIEKIGSKQCVALVQKFTPGVGNTSLWKEGEPVLGNKDIVPGTAIATFINGRYPSAPHGNHAAYFVAQGVDGFFVMDQWADDEAKPFVSKHFISTKGKKKQSNGWWPEGGRNAYAYSVIER